MGVIWILPRITVFLECVRETQQDKVVLKLFNAPIRDSDLLPAHWACEVSRSQACVTPYIVLQAVLTECVKARKGFGAMVPLEADLA